MHFVTGFPMALRSASCAQCIRKEDLNSSRYRHLEVYVIE